jgi:hypothetical protein
MKTNLLSVIILLISLPFHGISQASNNVSENFDNINEISVDHFSPNEESVVRKNKFDLYISIGFIASFTEFQIEQASHIEDDRMNFNESNESYGEFGVRYSMEKWLFEVGLTARGQEMGGSFQYDGLKYCFDYHSYKPALRLKAGRKFKIENGPSIILLSGIILGNSGFTDGDSSMRDVQYCGGRALFYLWGPNSDHLEGLVVTESSNSPGTAIILDLRFKWNLGRSWNMFLEVGGEFGLSELGSAQISIVDKSKNYKELVSYSATSKGRNWHIGLGISYTFLRHKTGKA